MKLCLNWLSLLAVSLLLGCSDSDSSREAGTKSDVNGGPASTVSEQPDSQPAPTETASAETQNGETQNGNVAATPAGTKPAAETAVAKPSKADQTPPENDVWDQGPGLAVGQQAPAFDLKDQHGTNRSLAELLKSGNVALVFYRSADW